MRGDRLRLGEPARRRPRPARPLGLALRRRAADRARDPGLGGRRRHRGRRRTRGSSLRVDVLQETVGAAGAAGPRDDRAAPAARLPPGPHRRHGRSPRWSAPATASSASGRSSTPSPAARRSTPAETRATYLPVVRELVDEGLCRASGRCRARVSRQTARCRASTSSTLETSRRSATPADRRRRCPTSAHARSPPTPSCAASAGATAPAHPPGTASPVRRPRIAALRPGRPGSRRAEAGASPRSGRRRASSRWSVIGSALPRGAQAVLAEVLARRARAAARSPRESWLLTVPSEQPIRSAMVRTSRSST